MKKNKEESLAELKEFFEKNIHAFIDEEIARTKKLTDIVYLLHEKNQPSLSDIELYQLAFNTNEKTTKNLLSRTSSRSKINEIIGKHAIPYWKTGNFSENNHVFREITPLIQLALTNLIYGVNTAYVLTDLDSGLNNILANCQEDISDSNMATIYNQALLNNLDELKRLAAAQVTLVSGEINRNPDENTVLATLLCLIEQIESALSILQKPQNTSSVFESTAEKKYGEKQEIIEEINNYNVSCSKQTVLWFRKSAKTAFLDAAVSLINKTPSSYQRKVLFEYAATMPLSVAGKKGHETETAKAFRTLAEKCIHPEQQEPVIYRGKRISP